MKTIRNFAAALLLITGILHIVLFIQTPDDHELIGVLVFGIIYGITGLLLFTRKRYPLYLGVIIPIIGMTLSIIKFGFPELLSMLGLFKIIGLAVVILCIYLLTKRT